MTKILFISWDGPQTSYMEGLFLPIFGEIQNKSDYVFHVVQFTWGSKERIAITQDKAKDLNIVYTSKTISRKPIASLGSLLTLYKGIQFLQKYIKTNQIDIVMPRSTMPSIMINRLKDRNFKLVFDADGLPLEERVDFSGLSRTNKQYLFFKKEEYKMLMHADGVITRSHKSIAVHLETISGRNSNKFTVVLNGRNAAFFEPNDLMRSQIRSLLKIKNESKLFVYCGSLGPQYGWDEMIAIFQNYKKNHKDSKFLILTGNTEFALERIPQELSEMIVVKKVVFEEVPNYLSAADVAFAIREPKFSMQGVAPIKLGEYLLMGIPTIASAGIGDTERLIKEVPNCFVFNHNDQNRINKAVDFIEKLEVVNHEKIREFGITNFSIEKSAESYCNALNKLK